MLAANILQIVQDEEPINCTPRQIFGPLKREVVVGVAASAIHSVAFTSTSLYTWGKNEGQLGLMDSDSRSLEAQTIPRRVAASLFTSPIQMVSTINRATICLLANHAVYVFTNYGYNNVKFPTHDSFSNYHLNDTAITTRYEAEPSHISSVTSGGETIAAISSRGDLFTLNVSQKVSAPSLQQTMSILNGTSPA
jgi:inhibitor of Bruton tyrosine kinase